MSEVYFTVMYFNSEGTPKISPPLTAQNAQQALYLYLKQFFPDACFHVNPCNFSISRSKVNYAVVSVTSENGLEHRDYFDVIPFSLTANSKTNVCVNANPSKNWETFVDNDNTNSSTKKRGAVVIPVRWVCEGYVRVSESVDINSGILKLAMAGDLGGVPSDFRVVEGTLSVSGDEDAVRQSTLLAKEHNLPLQPASYHNGVFKSKSSVPCTKKAQKEKEKKKNRSSAVNKNTEK